MPDGTESDVLDDPVELLPVAVVGMAARVPGAADVTEFWENLLLGRESVVQLDDADLRAHGVSTDRLADPDYVRAAAPVDHVEDFDAAFFRLVPRDAAATDPQIRLFLEIAHSVLENAGYDPDRMDRSVGVVAAVGPSRYATLHLGEDAELAGGVALGQHTLTQPDYLATTVSYRLDLRGPSMTVLTACSSSLVALHLGCAMLRAGDCEAVIVGGSNVEFPVGCGYPWTPGGILSREGHCRPFDASADGTVFGSGAAAVLLKPLDEALADGDRVSAVVLGSAMNNDGADKVSFSAPSHTGQASVVMEAMSLAGVSPEEIGYVEAHGTGTRLGDPIEVAALTEAYSMLANEAAVPASCGIGSVKGNVGHLGPTAGIIGFIKAALALEHEQLPPSINLGTPNPAIDFAAGPFEPVRELRAWPRGTGRPRRAAVSSLGIGGSNVHVVLGEAPEPASAPLSAEPRLLVWSGRDEQTRDASAARLADWLVKTGDAEFADIAATLQHGRTAHPERGAVVAASAGDAVRALADPAQVTTTAAPARLPGLAADDAGAFRRLAHRLPTLEAELRSVLTDSDAMAVAWPFWEGDTAPGDRPDPVLAVATRAALARVWISAGADLAAIADPVGLAGVLDCVRGEPVTTAAARLAGNGHPQAAMEDRGPEDSDLWTAHLSAVAQLWVGGAELDWHVLGLPSPARRADLPGYPYDRRRFWVEPLAQRGAPLAIVPGPAPMERWVPGWRDASAEPMTATHLDSPVLVLAPADRAAVRPVLVALRTAGCEPVCFTPAADFAVSGDDLSGRPDDPEHLAKAIAAASSGGEPVRFVVHALGLGELEDEGARGWALATVSALAGLSATDGYGGLRTVLVAKHSADVSGSEETSPAGAELAAAALASLPDCRWIDLGPKVPPDSLAGSLAAALGSDEASPSAALRGHRRWVPDRLPLPPENGDQRSARRGRHFLVVDRDGDFAARIVGTLAHAGAASSVLIATAAEPPAREAMLAAEDAGATVRVLDWSGDPAELPATLRSATRESISGVLAVVNAGQGARPVLKSVAAGLLGRPFDLAIALRPAGDSEDPAAALAWAGAAGLDAVAAERALAVAASPATVGSVVLDALEGSLAANVVSVA
jgi:3-oxoacyl-(acyl-carrier-protein) synthase